MSTLDGIRILVVDDEPFMRATIKAVLRAAGRFDVVEADDGDVALAEVELKKPDIVLCDINMPRMEGLRFVELLRKHPAAQMRETPVIILTGRAEVTTVIAASKLQINGYLVKPVSPKQIDVLLQKALGTRQAVPLNGATPRLPAH
jgi:two-component system chemotaxis response regulator CheY